MTSRNRQFGWSLIEAAIVLVIVAAVSALVVAPFMVTGASIDAEAERVAADIRYVQFLSMSLNQRFRINFSSDQYSLTELDGTTEVMHPVTASNIVLLGSGVSLATDLTNNYLVFDSMGVPYVDNEVPGTALDTVGNITLTLDGENRVITITPETGKVTVP